MQNSEPDNHKMDPIFGIFLLANIVLFIYLFIDRPWAVVGALLGAVVTLTAARFLDLSDFFTHFD